MKLVRENSGCNGEDGIKQWRGKHCFRIYGKPEEIDLIDQIEDLIGNEVYSQIYVDDVLKVTLWKHKASQIANELMYIIAKHWGGQSLYIVKVDCFLADERDIQIYSEFNGHNHAELAQKYDLSTIYILS